MTIERLETVKEILAEDPNYFRVYRYRNTRTGQHLYAMFARPQHDDMATSPMVRDAVVIWELGEWRTP